MHGRKKPRQRLPLVNPLALVLEKIKPISDADLERVKALQLGAIEAFAQARAEPLHWKELADLVNLAETAALMGIGPEVIEPARLGAVALAEALRRKREHGRLAFSGPELTAMRELVEWHRLQMTAVHRGEYDRVLRHTARRIRAVPSSERIEID